MYPRTSPGYDEFGGSIPSAFTAGAASLQVVRPNQRRKSMVFVNDSANIIYLAKGVPAVIGSGIRLNAGGGSFWEPDTVGRIWKGSWFGIATGAGSNMAVTEDW